MKMKETKSKKIMAFIFFSKPLQAGYSYKLGLMETNEEAPSQKFHQNWVAPIVAYRHTQVVGFLLLSPLWFPLYFPLLSPLLQFQAYPFLLQFWYWS